MGDGMTNILLGAASWQAPQWVQAYYPEGLPEEWRLPYYANEFSTTLIDCQQYLGEESLDQLADILEDCHYGFRPVLSISVESITPAQVKEFLDFLDVLDPDIGLARLAGVYLTGHRGLNDRDMLRQWRTSIPGQLPIALDYGSSQGDISQGAVEQGMSLVWESGHAAGKNHGSWLIFIDLNDDPREVGNQIQSILRSASGGLNTLCIIASKGYEDIDKLRSLSTMLDLIHG
jgi:hypothetical protein